MEDKEIELSDEQKRLYQETANRLKGYERRVFMAGVVKTFGKGGQRRAERELGWGRASISKGMHELESGLRCVEAYAARGRKRATRKTRAGARIHRRSLRETLTAVLRRARRLHKILRRTARGRTKDATRERENARASRTTPGR